jgi:hypothetical protein
LVLSGLEEHGTQFQGILFIARIVCGGAAQRFLCFFQIPQPTPCETKSVRYRCFRWGGFQGSGQTLRRLLKFLAFQVAQTPPVLAGQPHRTEQPTAHECPLPKTPQWQK